MSGAQVPSTRRAFTVGAIYAGGVLALPAGVGALLAGCTSSAQRRGPVAVHWDREPCASCRMVISDRRFATQLRGGPDASAFKFDDLGCAIGWLEQQPWGRDTAVKVWVTGPTAASAVQWEDASHARFQRRHGSPMGYDFAPTTADDPQGVSFTAARDAVLDDMRRRSQAGARRQGERS